MKKEREESQLGERFFEIGFIECDSLLVLQMFRISFQLRLGKSATGEDVEIWLSC